MNVKRQKNCSGNLATLVIRMRSRPQVIKSSRQYLLLRTDISQKTVVGCLCCVRLGASVVSESLADKIEITSAKHVVN